MGGRPPNICLVSTPSRWGGPPQHGAHFSPPSRTPSSQVLTFHYADLLVMTLFHMPVLAEWARGSATLQFMGLQGQASSGFEALTFAVLFVQMLTFDDPRYVYVLYDSHAKAIRGIQRASFNADLWRLKISQHRAHVIEQKALRRSHLLSVQQHREQRERQLRQRYDAGGPETTGAAVPPLMGATPFSPTLKLDSRAPSFAERMGPGDSGTFLRRTAVAVAAQLRHMGVMAMEVMRPHSQCRGDRRGLQRPLGPSTEGCLRAFSCTLDTFPPLPPRPRCIRRGGTSEAAPEAVRQAVGGGCQSGRGRLLSVTNAAEAGTWRQGDSGWAYAGRLEGAGGVPPPLPMHPPPPPQPLHAERGRGCRRRCGAAGAVVVRFAGRCVAGQRSSRADHSKPPSPKKLFDGPVLQRNSDTQLRTGRARPGGCLHRTARRGRRVTYRGPPLPSPKRGCCAVQRAVYSHSGGYPGLGLH